MPNTALKTKLPKLFNFLSLFLEHLKIIVRHVSLKMHFCAPTVHIPVGMVSLSQTVPP